jgi:hypothetical protein
MLSLAASVQAVSPKLWNGSQVKIVKIGYVHKDIRIYVSVSVMARSREIFSPLLTEMLTAG